MSSPVRNGRRIALSLALLVVGGGCEFRRSPTGLELEGSVPGVYALLVAGEDQARVLVVRFSADVPVGDGGILPVGDADVRLVRGGEETILTPGDVEGCVGEVSSHLVQPGEACYTATLPRAVASGDRFELTVRLADDTTVRGTAVVPGASVVSSPSPGDTVRVSPSRFSALEGSLPMEVMRPPDGALLEVAVETFREGCLVGLGRPEDEFLRAAGTVRLAPDDEGDLDLRVGVRCLSESDGVEPLGELPSRFLALAYDTAYARWIGELAVDGHDLPVDRASAGLTGAVGYFAGASRVAVPLEIVEE